MFGSRNDDEKAARRRLWPWGRREAQPEETGAQCDEAPQAAEPADQEAADSPQLTPQSDQLAAEGAQKDTEKSPKEGSSSGFFARMRHTFEKPQQDQAAPEVESAEPAPEQAVLARADSKETEATQLEPELESEPEGGGFLARMRQGLSKTRSVLVEGVAELFIGKKEIDDDLLEELETQLLVADVGVEATSEIISKLTERVKYRELDDADALVAALKAELAAILAPADKPLVIDAQHRPYVILVVGVNGVGKTTTIGKLARQLQQQGKSVMLAAGDTFRAAAVEQLQVWGERNRIPVIAQHTGADSASVIYDAFEAARARGVDVLIADTAGRLHNKDNLMTELKKVKRVLAKLDDRSPHEVLLVLDAGTGQNALNQARLFHESVGLTGMALTKLDGTAKGGVIFALSRQMQLPIRFLGVGEQIEDLRPFVAGEFVEALFGNQPG